MASNSKSKPSGQQTRRAPRQNRERKVLGKPQIIKNAHVPYAQSAFKTLKSSSRMLEMAKGIILPGSVSNAQPYPANTPAQMCTRLIKKNYVIGASNLSADGRTAIVVTPNMYGPAFILRPGTTLLPLAPHPFSMGGDFTGNKAFVLGCVKGFAEFKSGDGDESALAQPISVTLGGDTRSAWDVSCATICDMLITMKKTTKYSGYARCVFYTSTGGAWAAPFKGPPLGEMNVDVQLGFTMGAGTRYFGFYFEDASGASIALADLSANVHISYGNPGQTPQATLGGSSDHLFQEIPEYVLDSGIDSGVVNSVAVLVSNTSAELEKQGEIFAARAPRSILHDWSSLQDSMVALPSNREYHGLAATGAYSWWMPDTVEAANPTTAAEYFEVVCKQDILVIYVKGLSVNASFNVTFVWNVSFHTRNQLFEKVQTPPMSPEWVRLYHALALLPAASCNPEHENLFSSIIRRGTKAAGSVYAHYKKHQALYDGLIQLLATAPK